MLVLILIMAVVALGVAGITLIVLYKTAFEQQRERLVETAQSQARLVEAIARFDMQYIETVPGGAFAATLAQIRDAHQHFKGFGKTGEFTLAKRVGDQISFLLSHRHHDLENPEPVPFSSKLAEPMRRALSGISGTVVGLDYRGEMVLAAHEPVREFDLGIVAKIDLTEIRAPFINAGSLAGGSVLVLIFLGTVLFRRVGDPLIRDLEENEKKYRTLFSSATEGVFLMSDVFEDCNEQACQLWACEYEDIIGHSLTEFLPPTQPDGRDSAEVVKERIKTTLSGTPQFFYCQFLRKDGSFIGTDFSLKAIEVGGRKVILASVRDVTERKRAEEATQEEEQRLRLQQATLVQLARLTPLEHGDKGGTFREITESAARTLQVERVSVRLLEGPDTKLCCRDLFELSAGCHSEGQELAMADYPDYFAALQDNRVIAAHDARTDPRTHEFSKRYLIPLEITAVLDAPIRMAGDTIGVVCFEHIGSTRKWSADEQSFATSIADLIALVIETAEHRQVEKNFRELLESAPDAIVIVDQEGQMVLVNSQTEKLFGYSRDELYELKVENLMPERCRAKHPDYREDYMAEPRLRAMGATADALYGVRKDGSEFPVEISLSPTETDAGMRIISVVRDITERKQAEKALREKEQFHKALLDDMITFVAVLDPNGNIIFVNNTPLVVSGIDLEDVKGKKFFDAFWWAYSDEVQEKIKGDIEQCASGKSVVHDVQLQTADGSLMWIEYSMHPIYDEHGDVQYLIPEGRDITERKRIEAELADERQKLEERVQLRTEELRESLKKVEDANLRLEDANRAKARFLSSMSHELRTPLNGILGFADLLHGQYFGKLSDKLLGYVKRIDDSGKHLLLLINDLLDMAKIDAGAMEAELEEVMFEEIINATTDMMSSQFRKKKISVKTFFELTPTAMMCDRRKCKQIILNLLSNAVKYTPMGGRVEVRTIIGNNGSIRIEVSDTGIGIEADQRDKIFSEFHQADRVRDEQLGGTGIGLSLTRRLVELHGGEIGVDSELGSGSTFWFTLPLIRPTSKQADIQTPVIANAGPAPTGRRILVAEDNEVNLAMILDILSIHDHEVAVARNGQEAIELAQSHRPELILMDIRMPVMDGVEATRRLRAMSEFDDTPIIALTASTGSEAETRQITAGCTAHMAKPIQSQALFALLKHYLCADPAAGDETPHS